ncbi:MAG: inositol monophosphatase, partial [Sphingomonadaceae bacterium]|nr:inositol monophosphatase [Sphingomonadaceae bacterium]
MAGSDFRSRDPLLYKMVMELIRTVTAEQIMPRWQNLLGEQVSEKTPGDLVTVADYESEARLTE